MIEELQTVAYLEGNRVHQLVGEYYEMQDNKTTLKMLNIYLPDDLSETEAAQYCDRGKSNSIWMLIDFEIKATEV